MFARFFLIFAFIFSTLWADFKLNLSANVSALKLSNDELFLGLDNGELYKYNLKSTLDFLRAKQNINPKTLLATTPKISNFFETNINAKIYDIDEYNGLLALLIEGNNGSKNLGILKQNSKLKIINLPLDNVKKIIILDENTIVLLSFSSEIYYFDLKSQKSVFSTKLSTSSFGDASFDRAQNTLALGCEGGVIFLFNTASKTLLSKIEAQKDSIYSLSLENSRLLSGSADKQAYYFDGLRAHYFDTKFLVYATALSQKYGAYSLENGINIIDKNASIIKKLNYNGASLNYLFFYDEILIGAGYDNFVQFWELK